MIIPKSMRDIRAPKKSEGSGGRGGSKQMGYTSFVINEIKSPKDIKIDRQLQSIFNRLNQSYSTSINSPHTAFLKQQLDDFMQLSQTVQLFSSADQTKLAGFTPAQAEPVDEKLLEQVLTQSLAELKEEEKAAPGQLSFLNQPNQQPK